MALYLKVSSEWRSNALSSVAGKAPARTVLERSQFNGEIRPAGFALVPGTKSQHEHRIEHPARFAPILPFSNSITEPRSRHFGPRLSPWTR